MKYRLQKLKETLELLLKWNLDKMDKGSLVERSMLYNEIKRVDEMLKELE